MVGNTIYNQINIFMINNTIPDYFLNDTAVLMVGYYCIRRVEDLKSWLILNDTVENFRDIPQIIPTPEVFHSFSVLIKCPNFLNDVVM